MISAVILTKNEAKNIGECLKSVAWCDEKIVIDDYSKDNTAEIAERSGAKVIKHKLINFSDQRNFGLEKARNEWVLFVDADERVSQALWYEIDHSINNTLDKIDGFYIRRNDIIWGKTLRHGENSGVKLMRLARKTAGKWTGDVHERWEIKGTSRVLNHFLDHYPHQTVAEFLEEINYYTEIRARELYKNKSRSNWFSIIFYTGAKFFQNYFYKKGFLDGIPGFITALMMSFHSFLVRGKLWMLCKTEQKIS